MNLIENNSEKQKKEYLESVTQIKKNLNLNFSKVVYTNIFDVENGFNINLNEEKK